MIQVFHLQGNVFVRTVEAAKEVLRNGTYPNHYSIVAEVDTDDLEVAFEKTNHIDTDWTENAGVTPMGGRRVRSTSVGDIAKLGEDYWFCAPVGWTKMERPW